MSTLAPHLIRWLNQDLTLWPAGSGFDSHGRPVLGSPEAIKGRWENRQERFVTADGREEVSRAVAHVDRSVLPGSWVMLGSSIDADGRAVTGAYAVRAFTASPSLDDPTVVLRKVYL